MFLVDQRKQNSDGEICIVWAAIAIGVPVIVVLAIVLLYNTLTAKKNQVTNVFGGIDAMLKKRYDLLPKLIVAVKQYMQHERGVLDSKR